MSNTVTKNKTKFIISTVAGVLTAGIIVAAAFSPYILSVAALAVGVTVFGLTWKNFDKVKDEVNDTTSAS